MPDSDHEVGRGFPWNLLEAEKAYGWSTYELAVTDAAPAYRLADLWTIIVQSR
jgi:hypothetical protein